MARGAMVRHLTWRLVLFFVVETLAISAMASLLMVGRENVCHDFMSLCVRPEGDVLFLGIAAILGELTILAVALKVERPVWRTILGLGVGSFFGGVLFLKVPIFAPDSYGSVMVRWHFMAS